MKELTLDSSLNNEYSELMGILTGESNRVDVLVEDELDVPFWYDVLHTEYPDKEFYVTPYQYKTDSSLDLSKGKKHILDEADNGKMGNHYIGCVDSDYDYLLKSKSRQWKSMQSPWIIQTYNYAIENLMCHPATLCEVCSKAVTEIPHDDFIKFMADLSMILYPMLKWSMYMEDIRCGDFTVTSWGSLFDCSLTGTLQYVLDETKKKVEATILALKTKHPDADTELARCEFEYLTKNGVKATDCYQYVRGHDLFHFVLKTVLEPIAKNLKNDHVQQLRTSNTNPSNAVNHYLKLTTSVESVLTRNYEYKKYSPCYAQIQKDLHAIF